MSVTGSVGIVSQAAGRLTSALCWASAWQVGLESHALFACFYQFRLDSLPHCCTCCFCLDALRDPSDHLPCCVSVLLADEVLGGGGCARVHSVHLVTTAHHHLPCVAKLVEHPACEADSVLSEAHLSLSLPHPHLVACLGYVALQHGTCGIPVPAMSPLQAEVHLCAEQCGAGSAISGLHDDRPLSGVVQGWFSTILTPAQPCADTEAVGHDAGGRVASGGDANGVREVASCSATALEGANRSPRPSNCAALQPLSGAGPRCKEPLLLGSSKQVASHSSTQQQLGTSPNSLPLRHMASCARDGVGAWWGDASAGQMSTFGDLPSGAHGMLSTALAGPCWHGGGGACLAEDCSGADV